TGPLHIAAASGIYTLGLYPDKRPMHAGRWGPIGIKANYIESSSAKNAADLTDISVEHVYQRISRWSTNKD
ncbi:MAG: glycosyl transferase, partial [Bacteroidota bacterium]